MSNKFSFPVRVRDSLTRLYMCLLYKNILLSYSDFIRLECRFMVRTSAMHLATSFMTLYTCLLDEIKGQATAEGSDRMSKGQVSDNFAENHIFPYFNSKFQNMNLKYS